MSVTTTTARLAALWRNIDGVQKVFDKIPRVVQDAELPAVIILPGEATYDTDAPGDNDVLITRTYRMLLLVFNAGLGTEGKAQTAAEPFFDRVRDYFLARPGLELYGAADPQVVEYNARLLSDSGFIYQAYPGGTNSPEYGAIEFRQQVQTWASVVYQDGG